MPAEIRVVRRQVLRHPVIQEGERGSLGNSKPGVFLVHGENRRRQELAGHLEEQYGVDAELPGLRDVIEL